MEATKSKEEATMEATTTKEEAAMEATTSKEEAAMEVKPLTLEVEIKKLTPIKLEAVAVAEVVAEVDQVVEVVAVAMNHKTKDQMNLDQILDQMNLDPIIQDQTKKAKIKVEIVLQSKDLKRLIESKLYMLNFVIVIMTAKQKLQPTIKSL